MCFVVRHHCDVNASDPADLLAIQVCQVLALSLSRSQYANLDQPRDLYRFVVVHRIRYFGLPFKDKKYTFNICSCIKSVGICVTWPTAIISHWCDLCHRPGSAEVMRAIGRYHFNNANKHEYALNQCMVHCHTETTKKNNCKCEKLTNYI